MMHQRTLLSLALIASFVFSDLGAEANAQSDDVKAAAREVLERNQSIIFGVKSMVKIEASMKGQQVLDREVPAYGVGTVIADRMLVASYRTIKPKAVSNVPGYARLISQGLKLNTEVKEIKLVDESGEEFDAKLVLHDEDLDLAFISLDPDGDNAESWSCTPVDTSSDPELVHLDDVVYLSRASESMRFQPSIRIGQVHTIIKRPRRLYATSSPVLGAASFNAQGQFIGLGIRKASDAGGQFSAVLPVKYIRKLLPQAIEKAASTEQEEDEENSESEPDSEPKSEDAAVDDAIEGDATEEESVEEENAAAS